MNRMSLKLSQDNFEASVLKEEKTVLVDFYSDSCVPCKRLSTILAELEETYGEKIVIGKVNVMFEQELVQKYDIISSPTILVFKQGAIKKKFVGKIQKEDLVQEIEKNI